MIYCEWPPSHEPFSFFGRINPLGCRYWSIALLLIAIKREAGEKNPLIRYPRLMLRTNLYKGFYLFLMKKEWLYIRGIPYFREENTVLYGPPD